MSEPHWNTSEGLLRNAPEMDQDPAWETFAKAYDEQGARMKRLDAWKVTQPAESPDDSELALLEDLSRIACGKHNARTIFAEGRLADIHPDKAARSVASILVDILTERPPIRLRELLAIAEGRESTQTPTRNISDAIEALRAFIARERRLPGKAELNIEANRLFWAQSFRTKGRISRLEWGDLYNDGTKLVDSFHTQFVVIESIHESVIACPKTKWDQPRWSKSEFGNSTLKPAGLSGLRMSRQSKL